MAESVTVNAQLLQVHFCAGDRCDGRPLHEVLVEKCRELGMAGATVIAGREGFGESGSIRRAPVVVTVVDSPEKIALLTAAIQSVAGQAVIAVEPVRCRRVRKSGA